MNKFIILVMVFSGLTLISQNINEPPSEISLNESKNTNSYITEEAISTNTPIFTSSPIPKHIYKNMLGKSIPYLYKDKVDINTLSYLQVSYIGFDNNSYVGEMIVNSNLADDVLNIFKELYEIRYPIEKIRLVDEYDANDELSMSDNNTSSFCYRVISGTSTLSNHSSRHCNRHKSII